MTKVGFHDGYANVLSRLGTSADRATAGSYYVPLLTPPEIEAAYRSSWLTRRVHDLLPFEMTRAGRDWQAEAPQIEALEAYERRRTIDVWGKLRRALTVARLHGGAAVIMGVRQGGSADPSKSLDVTRVGKDSLRYLLVVSRHQLSAPRGIEGDVESDFYGEPAMYEIQLAKGRQLIHPSRVIPFHGSPLPPGSFTVDPLTRFWGDPLLYSIKTAIDNAESVQASVATLVHEIKQDVVSIPGFTEMLATAESEALIAGRIDALARFKSMFNALLLDGGDDDGKGAEKWETRQLSFAEFPQLIDKFLGIVAGASGVPVTRLMGESPGGLQSTGKGEQDDLFATVDALREAELRPALDILDEVLIRSALGSRPAEVYSEFGALAPEDETAASENEKRDAETVEIYTRTNLIPKDALAKAAANRLVESGRWPGLDKAIEESAQELGALDDPEADPNEPEPATPGDPAAVDRMTQRGTVTDAQALALLADASPRPLYVSRRLLNADEVLAWAKGHGIPNLEAAADLHVTVVYSRRPVDWMKVDETWNNDKSGGYTLEAGGPRMVERLGEGALALLFSSSSLAYRHGRILEQSGGSHDFSEYQPHVTIAYDVPADFDLSAVTPFRGALRFGPEIFEEAKA